MGTLPYWNLLPEPWILQPVVWTCGMVYGLGVFLIILDMIRMKSSVILICPVIHELKWSSLFV